MTTETLSPAELRQRIAHALATHHGTNWAAMADAVLAVHPAPLPRRPVAGRDRDQDAARIDMLQKQHTEQAATIRRLKAERDLYAARTPLTCTSERHDAKVRGLELLLEKTRADADTALAAESVIRRIRVNAAALTEALAAGDPGAIRQIAARITAATDPTPPQEADRG